MRVVFIVRSFPLGRLGRGTVPAFVLVTVENSCGVFVVMHQKGVIIVMASCPTKGSRYINIASSLYESGFLSAGLKDACSRALLLKQKAFLKHIIDRETERA